MTAIRGKRFKFQSLIGQRIKGSSKISIQKKNTFLSGNLLETITADFSCFSNNSIPRGPGGATKFAEQEN